MRRKSIAVIAAALMVMVAVMAGFTGCGDKSAKSDKVIKIGLVQLVEHTSLDQIRESIIDELEEEGYVDGENIEIEISGRHDPVIVPRAVVVIESMAAVTLVDLLMQNMSSRIEYMKKIYMH